MSSLNLLFTTEPGVFNPDSPSAATDEELDDLEVVLAHYMESQPKIHWSHALIKSCGRWITGNLVPRGSV